MKHEWSSEPERVSRLRRAQGIALVAAVLAGLFLAGAIVFAIRSDERDTAPSGAGPYRGSEPPATFELPAFELTSYRGDRVASEALAGDVVLLTILDAQCTDACPILASVIAGTIDRLTPAERRHVKAIGITGDPVEDTPAAVERFLSARQAVGRLDYLLGSEEQLRPVWTALQILPSVDSGRDTVHSAPLRIYDGRGSWVATLHAGVDLTEENLLHDIRTALAASSR